MTIRDESTPAFQIPIPEKILALLGETTITFSILENSVHMLAWFVMSEGSNLGKARIITAELSFRNLRALTRSLIKEKLGEGDKLEAAAALMARAQRLEETRNQIQHSMWGGLNKDGHVIRYKVTAKEKHGFRIQTENISEQDLLEFTNAMKQLVVEIHRFTIQTFYEE